MKRILIIGGYGTFGGRLAQLLAGESGLTLVLAGRSKKKAEAFAAKLPLGAEKIPARFDRDGDLKSQFKELKPDLVVDATGPFQIYGGDPYRLVKAAIAAGVNYLDLADASDFVKGIERFDVEAKAKGVFVLSGVSSFPVLTAAVVRKLSTGTERIDSITAGIAPSPYAGVGLNVLRAIASYAGKPITLRRGGRNAKAYGLTETMRATIAVPGRLPLHNGRFSLVDVPDLQVLPDLWPEVQSIWMGAGPVPEILHRMLNGLAWLSRLKIIPSLVPLAPLFDFVIHHVRWGEHRGGMFVKIAGMQNGAPVRRSWHLLAEGSDGPLIPSMAAEAIVRRSLDGKVPAAGARAGVGDLELEDYNTLFARRQIFTGFWNEPGDKSSSLYRKILGDAWDTLPPAVSAMHEATAGFAASGQADIERGTNIFARFVCWLIGFPPAGSDVPVTVTFRMKRGGELWPRNFGGNRFSSFQMAGRGRWAHLLAERFGPFTVGLALVAERGKMRLIPRRWSFLGLPMPLALIPYGEAFENMDAEGRFHFDVEIKLPLIGLIVSYKGWLLPGEAKPLPPHGAPYSYRSDPAVPQFADDKPLFVFDGVCALCSGTAGWLLRHDKKDVFRFSPAQSQVGEALYRHYGLLMDETFMLLDEGSVYDKSDACVRILERLGGGWRIPALMHFVPKCLLDFCYDVIARNRYRWFGKTEYCSWIPEAVKKKIIS